MNTVANNIEQIKHTLPPEVCLVAVSKFHPAEMIREAYDAGQRVFGESKAQELVVKEAVLPKDIEWHFIGRLQTNKIKQIVPFISLIHSVDSVKLLQEINKAAGNARRTVSCLLQLHIAQEETKSGFSWQECREYLQSEQWKNLSHIQLCGVMGMATFTDDQNRVKAEFDSLRNFFDEIKSRYFSGDDSFRHISMGMSADYPLAIEAGSTMVRVGSHIFGERVY